MFIKYPMKKPYPPEISDEELLKMIDKKMGGAPLDPASFKNVVSDFDKKMKEKRTPPPDYYKSSVNLDDISFETRFESAYFMEL